MGLKAPPHHPQTSAAIIASSSITILAVLSIARPVSYITFLHLGSWSEEVLAKRLLCIVYLICKDRKYSGIATGPYRKQGLYLGMCSCLWRAEMRGVWHFRSVNCDSTKGSLRRGRDLSTQFSSIVLCPACDHTFLSSPQLLCVFQSLLLGSGFLEYCCTNNCRKKCLQRTHHRSY